MNQGDPLIYCSKRNHSQRSGLKHNGFFFLMILLWGASVILLHITPAGITGRNPFSWKLSRGAQFSFRALLFPGGEASSRASPCRAGIKVRQARHLGLRVAGGTPCHACVILS